MHITNIIQNKSAIRGDSGELESEANFIRGHAGKLPISLYSGKRIGGKQFASWGEERDNIDEELQKAYLVYREREYGSEISVEDLELFFSKFSRSVEKYIQIYLLLRELNDGHESGPKLKERATIDLFKFGRVARRFCNVVSMKIYAEIQKRVSRECCDSHSISWYTLLKLTEEEIREIQEERKPKGDKRGFWSIARACIDGLHEVCFTCSASIMDAN